MLELLFHGVVWGLVILIMRQAPDNFWAWVAAGFGGFLWSSIIRYVFYIWKGGLWTR